jgi:ATP/maltotriose-dependent transcriptional regulator MalT
VRLAELRRRQGRLEEAGEMFARAEPHPHASLGFAELAFDRGDARTAADLAERYLRRLHAANRLERAAGLEVGVRALLELGSQTRAREAADELAAIAAEAGTSPLLASAGLAAGLVARADGDLEAARRRFEDAVDRLQSTGAPYETARARIEFAKTLAALGRSEEARAEAERAIETLEKVRADGEIARARGVIAALEGEPAATPPSATSILTAREREVLGLIAQGLSNPEIGERLFVSEHTVHRHVSNILTKLEVPSRAAAVAEATRQKLL